MLRLTAESRVEIAREARQIWAGLVQVMGDPLEPILLEKAGDIADVQVRKCLRRDLGIVGIEVELAEDDESALEPITEIHGASYVRSVNANPAAPPKSQIPNHVKLRPCDVKWTQHNTASRCQPRGVKQSVLVIFGADMTFQTWVSVTQAAEVKGVSARTMRRYITSGLVYAERIGPKLIRIDLASLEALGTRLQYSGGDGE